MNDNTSFTSSGNRSDTSSECIVCANESSAFPDNKPSRYTQETPRKRSIVELLRDGSKRHEILQRAINTLNSGQYKASRAQNDQSALSNVSKGASNISESANKSGCLSMMSNLFSRRDSQKPSEKGSLIPWGTINHHPFLISSPLYVFSQVLVQPTILSLHTLYPVFHYPHLVHHPDTCDTSPRKSRPLMNKVKQQSTQLKRVPVLTIYHMLRTTRHASALATNPPAWQGKSGSGRPKGNL
nr:hypothetical protein L204_05027 [Cryptococcus depauperatus CBS 7855]